MSVSIGLQPNQNYQYLTAQRQLKKNYHTRMKNINKSLLYNYMFFNSLKVFNY
jgi:hypothetical protein